MFFYALTGLINAATSTVLGLFVFLNDFKSKINQGFVLFCTSVAVWSYGYYFWQIADNADDALFYSRVLMGGAIFISVSYLHFVLAFLGRLPAQRKLLIFSYAIFVIFFLLNFTPLFVKEVVPELSFEFWPKPGIVFHPFLMLWLAYVIYCTILLLLEYKNMDVIKKSQTKYILTGITIGFIGGSTNYLLWYGIPVLPIGNILVALYVIFTAYAITKHHLFDIKVILTEILVGSIGLVLFIQAWMSVDVGTKILNWVVFILFVIFGYYLIDATIQEIQRREQIERMDKELRKTYKELKKLDIAKSEFISIASHQLRTPLTAIKGYVSLIKGKAYGEYPFKMKKSLNNIHSSVERLIKLVNDLLSISRIEAGKIKVEPEEFFLEELIADILEELGNLAKASNLYLKWERTKASLSKVSMDRAKTRQVILNIIDNAIKYTQTGGVTINYKQVNGLCRIEIKDTGEGMTKAEISNLFKTFSRGIAGRRTWTEGAGLGLYIAKKFTEMHNGRIWVKSAGKKKGSIFYIELPIKYEEKS